MYIRGHLVKSYVRTIRYLRLNMSTNNTSVIYIWMSMILRITLHFILFYFIFDLQKLIQIIHFTSSTAFQELRCEVAIKIIKSRKPFMQQAQTEIALLMLMLEKDK